MRTLGALVLLLLLLPTPAAAQTTGQQTAHVVSWVSVLTLEGLDTYASFKAPDRKKAFALQGVRVGTVEVATYLLKRWFPQDRPCTPTHTCGADGEHSGMPSGHMALACSTAGGPALSFVVPLGAVTAVGRWAALRHNPVQITAGCALGLLTSRIR